MSSNSFGKHFKITTWGESHGQCIGVVIDGCPSGIEISHEEINRALELRSPGKNSFTSPRNEEDKVEICSGIFEGKTTGMPISLIIKNKDADSSKYESMKHILRPGHANFTYLEKYGIFDYRGGGRASARETACRVAAGAIAKKLIDLKQIKIIAHLKKMGKIESQIQIDENNFEMLQTEIKKSALFCLDSSAEKEMKNLIEELKVNHDSTGGIVEFIAYGVPVGLGDPVYEKLEATLAYAMMSIPASKGFEIGSGFYGCEMTGSQHNDLFVKDSNGSIKTKTNHSGGLLGGISNGMPIIGRVAFKPTSSIMQVQESLDINGERISFELPFGSRHDPCVAIRAVPVVESMLSLVLADALLALTIIQQEGTKSLRF